MANSIITLSIKAVVDGQQRVANLTGDLTSLGKAADIAAKAVGRTTAATEGSVLKLAAATTALNNLRSAVSSLSESYRSFGRSMREVNTMAKLGADDLKKLTSQVSELSKHVPLAREELASGLYQVISNGVPEGNWIEFLEQSSKAAVGGLAELGGVVTVTSTIIKNYAADWSAAGDIQDKIQLAARRGVTSFEQLQQALPRVTGNAADLGVSIDELLAVFSTLTGVSGDTAEVSTQLAAVLTALIKPSSTAAKTAADMGIQFNAAAIKAAGGFGNFLTQLDASVKRYSAASGMLEKEIYGKLFRSAEALRALGPLTGTLASTYQANIAAMADATGELEGAFESMATSGGAKAQMLKNTIDSMMDSVGQYLAVVQPIIDTTANLGMAAIGVAALGGSIKSLIGWLGKLVMAIPGTRAAVSALRTALVGLEMQCAAAGTSLGALAATMGAAATVVAGLGAAIYQLFRAFVPAHHEIDATATAQEILNNVTAQAQAEVAAYSAKLQGLVNVTRSATASDEEKRAAADKLNSIVGEGTAVLNKNTGAYDINTDAINRNVEAQMRAAQARGLEAQIEQQSRQRAEAVVARQRAVNQRAAAQEQLQRNSSGAGNPTRNVSSGAVPAASATANIVSSGAVQAAQQAYDDAEATIHQCDAVIAELTKDLTELGDTTTTHNNSGGRNSNSGGRNSNSGGRNSNSGGRNSHTDNYIAADDLRDMDFGLLKNLEEFKTVLDSIEHVKMTAGRDELPYWVALAEQAERARDAFMGITPDDPFGGVAPLDFDAATIATVAQGEAVLRRLQDALRESTESQREDWEVLIDQVEVRLRQLDRTRRNTEKSISNRKGDNDKGYKPPTAKKPPTLGEGYGALKSTVTSITGIIDKVREHNDVWTTATGIIDGVVSAYNNLATIIEAVKAIHTAFTATSVAETTERIAATQAETNANIADAAAETLKAHASIPWVGIAIGAGMVAAMVATMFALPKFAKGGIAYAPTIGMFGEYPGASHNPEVVAPLDKLRSLIAPSPAFDGEVIFKIGDRALVGVLTKRNRQTSRTAPK